MLLQVNRSHWRQRERLGLCILNLEILQLVGVGLLTDTSLDPLPVGAQMMMTPESGAFPKEIAWVVKFCPDGGAAWRA